MVLRHILKVQQAEAIEPVFKHCIIFSHKHLLSIYSVVDSVVGREECLFLVSQFSQWWGKKFSNYKVLGKAVIENIEMDQKIWP